jgi:predicted dehydrogenase
MRVVKVGLIGLGEVAQVIHLPVLASLDSRYEVVAACDVSERVLDEVATAHRIPRRYSDHRQLVADEDVEAVLVLVNDEYHAECTVAAVRAGRHVLVEKPMCLTTREADAVIRARDEANVQVMVGYMRRFAPAFLEAKQVLAESGDVTYAHVRDIVGANRLVIEQSSRVVRAADVPEALRDEVARRAATLVREAIGEASPDQAAAYRLLIGLGCHDLSAMRELLGMPLRVLAATTWRGGRFLSALLDHGSFRTMVEIGVDSQRRFDAMLEVATARRTVRVRYDTPYIRHLPTRLEVDETAGDAYRSTCERPTFTDAYTRELEHFHDVVVRGREPKTTPEDYRQDLVLFAAIIEALRRSDGAAVPIAR